MKIQELQTVMHTSCHRKANVINWNFWCIKVHFEENYNIFWPLLVAPCCSGVRKGIHGRVICSLNKKVS